MLTRQLYKIDWVNTLVRKKYRMIGLPEDLYLQCKEIVGSGKHGYSSVSELVKDGTRRRLEELKRTSKEFSYACSPRR